MDPFYLRTFIHIYIDKPSAIYVHVRVCIYIYVYICYAMIMCPPMRVSRRMEIIGRRERGKSKGGDGMCPWYMFSLEMRYIQCTHIHTYIHIHIHTHMHTHIHIHIHIHIYI